MMRFGVGELGQQLSMIQLLDLMVLKKLVNS
jgi:hypothetical protein